MITRGTTPTLCFNLPFDSSKIDALSICFSAKEKSRYAPKSSLLFDKGLSDVTLDGTTITLELTQEDTLAFSSEKDLEIQLRVTVGEKCYASKIYQTTVGRILKGGVLRGSGD